MKTMFLLCLLLVFVTKSSYSQINNTSKIEVGSRFNFHSKILNETRELLIYSPKKSSSKKLAYPVIYVFDAESIFLTAIGAVSFLNYSSSLPQMPEAYIIGIINTKRSRDMPVPQELEQPNGAKNFYSFLSEEVVPYINKTYSTSGLNILAGHSQGALFITYAAFQNPKLFPFIVALDAPMTVTKSVDEFYSKKLAESCGIKYASVKSLYGWDDIAKPNNSNCLYFSQMSITGETHETMPYKGLYEGLKFLFNDYLPPVKDLSLTELMNYYQSLEKKYGVSYRIPAKVLLESAKQNIGQSKKEVAIELLAGHDKIYASSTTSQQLLEKAKNITKGPDERVHYASSQPSLTDKEVQPYLGKWAGVLTVPGGTNLEIEWELKKAGDKYVMISDVMKQFKMRSDFLYMNENGELVWGRKHDGGGIYISTGKLSDNALTITGEEDLIGFKFPAGMPAFVKNTFVFKKV